MRLRGLLLGLRKPEETDIRVITKWLAEEAFIHFLYGSPMASKSDRKQQAEQFLQENAKDTTQNITLLAFNIYTQEPLALIFINQLNWKNRNAELNLAIGEADKRHLYYGSELYLLGLLYLFFELNLHKVLGYAYHGNTAALKLSQFAGQFNGILKQHVYKKGAFQDVWAYSLFKSSFIQFLKSHKHTLLKKYFDRGLLADWI